MIKSMTGFSKTEAQEKGLKAIVEIKSLNGKYLDISCRLPRSLSQREFEIRDLVKNTITRGTVTVSVNIDYESGTAPFIINEQAAKDCLHSLRKLQKSLKLRGEITFENMLHFSDAFYLKQQEDKSDLEWRLSKKALIEALKSFEKMRSTEGNNMFKDLQTRMKLIQQNIDKVELLGAKKIPLERERLRQRVAMLFESDEIDEHRLQMELVLIADKLDISEECVRMRSHIKFFFETLKSKELSGKKINFLMQEMNREINTIGSKANDTEISHIVVGLKEELERIREQMQNIE
ncbi:MAG: YicC/YloC family endoribonuclease [Bacteroidota bacterium]